MLDELDELGDEDDEDKVEMLDMLLPLDLVLLRLDRLLLDALLIELDCELCDEADDDWLDSDDEELLSLEAPSKSVVAVILAQTWAAGGVAMTAAIGRLDSPTCNGIV